MKAKTFNVRAGWRVYSLLALEFSDGIIGWSEYTVSNSLPLAVERAITDLANLIKESSRDNIRETIKSLRLATRQSGNGLVNQAISAIENALWDAKAKSLGTSVISLLGGKQIELPVYWSHFGTTRVRAHQHVNKPSLEDYCDIQGLVAEAIENNVSAVKTNIFIDEPKAYIYMPGFGRQNPNSGGTYMSVRTRERLAKWLQALREELPPAIEVALDINFNYTAGDLTYIGKMAEEMDIAWIELDSERVQGYEIARKKIGSRISTGENFGCLAEFVTTAQHGLADIYGIDCQWLGLSKAVNASEVANEYGLLVAPHNFNGHLSTHISASFACIINNFYLLEYDYDDVPWRDELFDISGRVESGVFRFEREVLGWGAEPNVHALEKYAA